MFELQSKTPLTFLDGARCRGLACDGCHLYLTVHGASCIIQLDECLHRTDCFNTCRAYTALCYDYDERCFWAAADEHPATIYKLNSCMEELDCIEVQRPDGCCTPIHSLSYNCCAHGLVVAFAQEIVQICPAAPEKQVCVFKTRQERFSRAISLCPYFLCHCIEGAKNSICVYSGSGKLLHKFPFPYGTELEAVILWPCVKDCKCHFLTLRTEQGRPPCLCGYAMTCEAVCNSLCRCNYDPCQPCPPPVPGGDACAEVLQSIALVEAALAHILNAEGEKIQKIVACSQNVCDILAVNESVNQTLNQVIFLEQILACKLESLSNCCDFCAQCAPCDACGHEHCGPCTNDLV